MQDLLGICGLWFYLRVESASLMDHLSFAAIGTKHLHSFRFAQRVCDRRVVEVVDKFPSSAFSSQEICPSRVSRSRARLLTHSVSRATRCWRGGRKARACLSTERKIDGLDQRDSEVNIDVSRS